MPSPIKEEELNQITKKVYALYATHGFDKISMDEIARHTNICKATLYRYFTSKEDIVRGMVDYMISHLNSVQFTATERIHDVMAGLREFYIKSVLITSLSGTAFLGDLKSKFPDCYEQYLTTRNEMLQRFANFYKESVQKGYFRDLSFTLVNRQFANMLPVIVDMNYLEEHGLALTNVLRDYYYMFICQILTEDYLPMINRDETCDFAEELTKVLLNDFFIDSIRRQGKDNKYLWINR